MKHKFNLLLVLLLLPFLLLSCDNLLKPNEYEKLTISDANSIFLGDNTNRSLADESRPVYKVLDDASVLATKFLNKNNKVVTDWGNPIKVRSLNRDYFALTFKQTTTFCPPCKFTCTY